MPRAIPTPLQLIPVNRLKPKANPNQKLERVRGFEEVG